MDQRLQFLSSYQPTADAQMDLSTLFLGNLRICRLLDSVMQKFVAALLPENEPETKGLPESHVHRLLRLVLNEISVQDSLLECRPIMT